MQIAIPLFDRFTALDAIGPYEVLSRLPEADVRWVAAEPGPVRSDNGMLEVVAGSAFEDVPSPDVLVFPGGWGTRALLEDRRVLDWVRTAHDTSTWTTSVCTGALVLGAAGVLDGLEATTHWLAMDLLASFGAIPVRRRVVEQGKVVTAAGVSAGLDMALTLAARIAGDEAAQLIQLYIEYDPQPPFQAGSLSSAPDAIVERAREYAISSR